MSKNDNGSEAADEYYNDDLDFEGLIHTLEDIEVPDKNSKNTPNTSRTMDTFRPPNGLDAAKHAKPAEFDEVDAEKGKQLQDMIRDSDQIQE
jgi:hypothetical protein